jgi:hypothetical protein
MHCESGLFDVHALKRVLVHWRYEKTGQSATLTQVQAETRARSQSCLSDWFRH